MIHPKVGCPCRSFFTGLDGLGRLTAHLRLELVVGFARPVAQDSLAELAQFFNHAILGRVGVGPIGHGLVKRVEAVVQAGQ